MQDVETLLTKAVTIDPKCSDGFLQLGILAASQHNYEKAIQLYTKASEINPQLAEAHYRLGVAYDRLGERDKAQQEFQLHDQIEKRQADAVERRTSRAQTVCRRTRTAGDLCAPLKLSTSVSA